MSTLSQRIAADASKFTAADLLGTAATWKRPLQADMAIEVNFIEGYDLADPAGVLVGTASPVALAVSSAVPGIARGHKLTIAGTDYDVLSVEPDSTGCTRLALSQSPAVQAGAISDGAGNVQVDENGFQVTP
jgi:hypothetical protein